MNLSHYFNTYMDFFKDNQLWFFLIMVVSAIMFFIVDKKRKDLNSAMAIAEGFVTVANKLDMRHKRLLYALMKSVSDIKYLSERFSIIGDSEADSFIKFSGDVLKCVNNKDISESQKITQVIYYLDSDYKPVYDQYLEEYLNEFDSSNTTKYRAKKNNKDIKDFETTLKGFVSVANKLDMQHKRLLYAIMKSVSDQEYLNKQFRIIGDSESNAFIQFSGDVLSCVYNKDIPESTKVNQVIYYLENNYKPVYDEYMAKYLDYLEEVDNSTAK